MPNTEFFERLTPSPGTLLALSLSAPMVLLAALPFSFAIALLLAILTPTLLISLSIVMAPKIQLANDELRVGRMVIPLSALGKAEAFSGEEARLERGPRLSTNSQRLFRGDIGSVVKIAVVDQEDPTDYLIFSTRKGLELVGAISANFA